MATNRRTMTSEQMREAVIAAIEKFSADRKPLATLLHNTIMNAGVTLYPRLWYGMPGYATSKDGPVLCFFREDPEYMTFGISEKAPYTQPTNGTTMMPCAWFFTELNDESLDQIRRTVQSLQ